MPHLSPAPLLSPAVQVFLNDPRQFTLASSLIAMTKHQIRSDFWRKDSSGSQLAVQSAMSGHGGLGSRRTRLLAHSWADGEAEKGLLSFCGLCPFLSSLELHPQDGTVNIQDGPLPPGNPLWEHPHRLTQRQTSSLTT